MSRLNEFTRIFDDKSVFWITRGKEIYCSTSMFLFTCKHRLSDPSLRHQKGTDLRVEEKTVHTPRIWLNSPVQVFVFGGLGEGSTVLINEMLLVLLVFLLDSIDINAGGDHFSKKLANGMNIGDDTNWKGCRRKS